MASIGKALGFGGGAPKAPNYQALAKTQAGEQQKLLEQQTYANRINQSGPQGSITYTPTKDASGNTLWSQQTTLSPEQQQIYDFTTGANAKFAGATAGMNPYLDTSNLSADLVNPGETYIDASMRYMQPQLDRQSQQLETQLANQGLMAGSEAYRNAKMDLGDQQDRARLQAIMGGVDKAQAARANDLQEQQILQNYPIQLLNMLRTGAQAQMPSYGGYSQAGQGQAADLLGAGQASFKAKNQTYLNDIDRGNAQLGTISDVGRMLFGPPPV